MRRLMYYMVYGYNDGNVIGLFDTSVESITIIIALKSYSITLCNAIFAAGR